MRQTSLTARLGGFLAVLVAGALALRWAVDLLRPYLWLFVAVVLLVGLWRLSSFLRRRW